MKKLLQRSRSGRRVWLRSLEIPSVSSNCKPVLRPLCQPPILVVPVDLEALALVDRAALVDQAAQVGDEVAEGVAEELRGALRSWFVPATGMS